MTTSNPRFVLHFIQALDVASPVVKSALDKAAPIAGEAASTISKAATPAVKSFADKVPQSGYHDP